MERQGQKDFYGLRLPKETERYVFKIMAVKMILESPEDFGIRLEGARLYAPGETVALTIDVDRPRLPLSAVADAAGISFRRMRILNPWITGDALPKGTFTVKIPVAAKSTFRVALSRWESDHPVPKVVYYKVRRGDTLSGIAKSHGVRLNDLMAWNSLHTRSVIRPGQSIAVRRTN